MKLTQLLAELKALEKLATPGEWKAQFEMSRAEVFTGIHTFRTGYFEYMDTLEKCENDANLIAQSRNALPVLIAELEKAIEVLKEVVPIQGNNAFGYRYSNIGKKSEELLREWGIE